VTFNSDGTLAKRQWRGPGFGQLQTWTIRGRASTGPGPARNVAVKSGAPWVGTSGLTQFDNCVLAEGTSPDGSLSAAYRSEWWTIKV